MSSIRYEMPTDLDALARCLERADQRTHLVGGGTDLLPKYGGRLPEGSTLIDLSSIPGLDAIEVEDGFVRIGANVTYTRLGQDPFLRARIPCLSAMAAQVGSIQVR